MGLGIDMLFKGKGGFINKFSGFERRKLYFNSINLLHDENRLKSVVGKLRASEQYYQKSNSEIKPFNLDLGKSTPKDFVSQLNADSLNVMKSPKFNHVKTAFYKIKVNDLFSKTQFHFHKEKLFMAKTEISEVIPNSKINNFSENLQEKYLGQVNEKLDYFMVRDISGNLLYVENQVFNICMYYFSSDNTSLDTILETIFPLEPKQQEKDWLSLI